MSRVRAESLTFRYAVRTDDRYDSISLEDMVLPEFTVLEYPGADTDDRALYVPDVG